MAPRSHRHRPVLKVAFLAVALALAAGAAGACSGDSAPVLSGQAAQGKQVARDKNCTSCHTADGNRSEGPTWKGLAGSQVRLVNGTVVADDAYLARAIKEPSAQIVAGYNSKMPVTAVSDSDVDALVAYIKALK